MKTNVLGHEIRVAVGQIWQDKDGNRYEVNEIDDCGRVWHTERDQPPGKVSGTSCFAEQVVDGGWSLVHPLPEGVFLPKPGQTWIMKRSGESKAEIVGISASGVLIHWWMGKRLKWSGQTMGLARATRILNRDYDLKVNP